jgi:hypothetical protein
MENQGDRDKRAVSRKSPVREQSGQKKNPGGTELDS